MIIDQLPAALSVDPTDELPIEKGQVTYKATASQLTGDKVSKSGDTMTGALNIKTTDFEDNVPPSATIWGRTLNFLDKKDAQIGIYHIVARTNGDQGVVLTARRKLNGADVDNSLELLTSSSGERKVGVSDSSVWRSTLGLGTSGAFPITIAQGGTSSTGTSTTTTVSQIATAVSGFTMVSGSYRQWGKVASVLVAVKSTNAISTYTDTTCCTIVSGKRPSDASAAIANDQNSVWSYIAASGAVHVGGTWAANQTKYIMATYLLP